MTLSHCVGPVCLAFSCQQARAGFRCQKLDGLSVPQKTGHSGLAILDSLLFFVPSYIVDTIFTIPFCLVRYYCTICPQRLDKFQSYAALNLLFGNISYLGTFPIWEHFLFGNISYLGTFPIWELTTKFPKSNIISLEIQEIMIVIQKSCIKTAGP